MTKQNKQEETQELIPNDQLVRPKLTGRPLKFKTRQELIDAIQKYLDETPAEKYTITGLGLAIGMSRQVLCDYNEREEFKDIITEAKQFVEKSYELSLREKGGAGNIFALKNMGWKDKQEIDQTINLGSTLSGLHNKADKQIDN